MNPPVTPPAAPATLDATLASPALAPQPSKLMNFRVDLDLFRGPLDLLLYLVRQHELDVADLSLAKIADQFVQHMEVLAELDFDAVGEFLEMASILIELKSRQVLPHVSDEEEVIDQQREELVQRLLEYKQYKDAAQLLQARSERWQQCFVRLSTDLPIRRVDAADQPIQEVEVWDLVSAFGRIMREAQLVAAPPTIIYDETPIQVYMQRIHDRLVQEPQIRFASIFSAGMHKSALIGMFLALLELVRHYDVAVEQPGLHGEIWIVRGDDFRPDFDLLAVAPTSGDEPATAKPR
jgi:segregation and condensation protein A